MRSVRSQTFQDFEVVVCDNHTGTPAKEAFDRVADERFKYIAPTTPLSMIENWEYATRSATGEYVSILIDKVCLRPSALAIVHDVLSDQPVDVISWRHEAYSPDDETRGYDRGELFYGPQAKCQRPFYFDCSEELARRFSFDARRGMEGPRYCWAKICFGAYHHSLIAKIRKDLGRLFFPLSPDYTSMIAALAYADGAIDVGEPLQVDLLTSVSNGWRYYQDLEYAFTYLKSVDPELSYLRNSPLVGLYGSEHNLIAHDYVTMQKRIGARMRSLNLDLVNLVMRAGEDIANRNWDRQEVKKSEQQKLLKGYFHELSAREKGQFLCRRQAVSAKKVREQLRLFAGQYPRIRHTLKKVLSSARIIKSTETQARCRFDNLHEALAHVDKYYQGLKARGTGLTG